METITGVNGTFELYDDHIVLKRGKLLGNFEKTTYLKDIIEVRIKKPGLVRGILSIATAMDDGGIDINSVEANVIALKSKQWDEAVKFKRLVEEAISRVKSAESSSSAADEIAKFKRLMDDGIITPEEFAAKKKQLLGI